MNLVFCATCNEHSVRRHEKNRCQRWNSAVNCCCYRAPPQAATPCCHHCCCCYRDGGSGGGSGTIFFLIVVVILLLFARPPRRHHLSPFLSPAVLSAGRCSPAFKAQWLVVVCSCPLPSLSSPALQRSSIIVLPAAGLRRISLLALRSRRGHSLRCRHGRLVPAGPFLKGFGRIPADSDGMHNLAGDNDGQNGVHCHR